MEKILHPTYTADPRADSFDEPCRYGIDALLACSVRWFLGKPTSGDLIVSSRVGCAEDGDVGSGAEGFDGSSHGVNLGMATCRELRRRSMPHVCKASLQSVLALSFVMIFCDVRWAVPGSEQGDR
jgi:hypothetical protein